MAQYPDNIRLQPKWGVLIYIDGYIAQIVGVTQGVDQQGQLVWNFKLEPSLELIKRYNIIPENLKNGLYESSLPFDLIIPLNIDPAWTRYLYLKTFDGEATEGSQRLLGKSSIKEIMDLKDQLIRTKAKEEVAKEKLLLMELDMEKYMRRNIMPIVEAMGPTIRSMIFKDERGIQGQA